MGAAWWLLGAGGSWEFVGSGRGGHGGGRGSAGLVGRVKLAGAAGGGVGRGGRYRRLLVAGRAAAVLRRRLVGGVPGGCRVVGCRGRFRGARRPRRGCGCRR